MRTCKAALVYGYGQKADGAIDEQTRERCRRALRLYRQGKVNWICLTVSAEKNNRLMADEMKDWLVAHGVERPYIVVIPRGGNTAGETEVCLEEIRYGDADDTKVIPVSSWYHCPRIWWLWLCRGYLVWPRASWQATHWSDLRIEPLKLLNALLRPFRSAKVMPAKT